MKYRNYNAKRALPLMAFAVTAFATSCSNDNLADGSSQSSISGKAQSVELTASLNDDNSTDTRVGMSKNDNKASFYWHKGEAILVQTVNGSTYSGVKFTTSAETGATTATFNGTISEGTLGTYAVYPYSEKHQFTSETTLTYNLPAAYTDYKVESNVFSKTESTITYPENSTNIPLVGKIEDGKIDFKHIGGLVVIRIDKMPATSGTLTVTADQQLSGNFTISDLSANEPKIETATASDDNGKVTFTFSNASTTSAGVFYLPLATGDYTNVKVAIGENEVDCGSVSISRAGITAVSIAQYSGEVTDYKNKLLRSYGNSKYYVGNNKYLVNDHYFVDLGLSVLWAETNVGANSATDYGNYYAWGETATKDSYSNPSSYTENPLTLDADHDAATVNWGASCRMPTKDEFDELLNETDNCTWGWTTVNGVDGQKVTSKKQGYTENSIFLPAPGYRYKSGTQSLGSNGCYWSSSIQSDDYDHAFILDFKSTYKTCEGNNRYLGCSVRPVAEK